MIHDGYGDQPDLVEEEFLVDMEVWLTRRAYGLCQTSVALSRIEDVKQEGRIVLWQARREGYRMDAVYAKAYYRMREVAWTVDPRQTGQTRKPPHTRAGHEDSIDRLLEAGKEEMVLAVEGMAAVEVAYHHGEIVRAINDLTPRQRRYVYARFWCGMDPVGGLHSNPGMRMARTNNPDLRRDILWTGSKRSAGAKRRLVEALEHLRGLVAS